MGCACQIWRPRLRGLGSFSVLMFLKLKHEKCRVWRVVFLGVHDWALLPSTQIIPFLECVQHVILSEAYDDCVADIGNLLPSCIFKSLAHFLKEHINRHRKTHGKPHGARCLNETLWKPRSISFTPLRTLSLMLIDTRKMWKPVVAES